MRQVGFEPTRYLNHQILSLTPWTNSDTDAHKVLQLIIVMENVIQRIAKYADIDTRRALGVYGKLPKTDFVPRKSTSIFHWFPASNKVIFIEFNPYIYEVYDGVAWDDDAQTWYWLPDNRNEIWWDQDDTMVHMSHGNDFPFEEFVFPQIIL